MLITLFRLEYVQYIMIIDANDIAVILNSFKMTLGISD